MRKHHICLLRAATLVVALSFILMGIMRQEHTTVLMKAVKICFECIGIG